VVSVAATWWDLPSSIPRAGETTLQLRSLLSGPQNDARSAIIRSLSLDRSCSGIAIVRGQLREGTMRTDKSFGGSEGR